MTPKAKHRNAPAPAYDEQVHDNIVVIVRDQCRDLANAAESPEIQALTANVEQRHAWLGALARSIHRVQVLAQVCREAEQELTDAMVLINRALPIKGDTTVEGLGKLSLRRGDKKQRWDSDELERDLAEVLAGGNDENGAVRRIVHAVIDCGGLDAPSKGWRTTSLEKYGLDGGDYRTSEPGAWHLQITEGVIDTTKGEDE